jgi:hypothetical protein
MLAEEVALHEEEARWEELERDLFAEGTGLVDGMAGSLASEQGLEVLDPQGKAT